MLRALALLLLLASTAAAQTLSPLVKQFVSVQEPVALTHVRVIDGTGAPARENQLILIRGGRIERVSDAPYDQFLTGDIRILDLTGYTVIPGLVGMHDHLFYPGGGGYNELSVSAPRLYLAAGVTTIRTTGSIEPYSDLSLKRLIDEGLTPGPHIFVTGPYLEGRGAFTPQMHELTGADDARRTVAYWAEEGVHDYKAYMNISRAELSAAIDEAHRRGLKITGHLCSIGFREAAALGIDDLEHGLVVDSEFAPGKQPDKCPSQLAIRATLMKLEVSGPEVQQTIRELVARHVAITSTLPVFETFVANRPPMPPTPAGAPPSYMQRVLDSMLSEARVEYLRGRARSADTKDSPWPVLFRKEMEFERAFARAGGLLLAGLDPTGYGGVVAGFGDQREAELLVEAGFSPLEAIKIATLNGAQYLGIADRVGTIAAGKQADLVVLKGDPSRNIADIENVETVFKDGVGYNSAKLIDSVRGLVGLH